MGLGLKGPLCVALDLGEREELMSVAKATAGSAGLLKVGLTVLHAIGREVVADVADLAPVFVDAKLCDIPAQVAGAVAAIDALGAWCVTVHATGGSEMVEAAVGASEGVKVIAVTVLTSLDGAAMERVGLAGPPADAVLRLAELALGAGAHGLVCSPLEAALLRARFGAHEDGGPILVVPGVRPGGEASHDQKRVASPAEAIAAGADVIVVGRPITRSSDPAAAAAAVAREAGR